MGPVNEIYHHTKAFPEEERYGLTLQLRKSSVSLPANMAESYGRKSTQDYIRSLRIANGRYLNCRHSWKLIRSMFFGAKKSYFI
jgi:four helix bundle protein